MSAKDTANMAATAKRSATSIQRLARCFDDLSQKDRNTLLDAVAILERHGNRTKNKAMGEKRQEQAVARARAKARAEADAVIKTWPLATTLDRIALIFPTISGADRLKQGASGDDARWELDYATREAIYDTAGDAVTAAVPYWPDRPAVPVRETLAARRAKIDGLRQRPDIIALATAWESKLKSQAKGESK